MMYRRRHRFRQLRQRFKHRLIDGVRALAASEDQQRRRRVLRSRRDAEELAPHRNTGDLAVAEVAGMFSRTAPPRLSPSARPGDWQSRERRSAQRQSSERASCRPSASPDLKHSRRHRSSRRDETRESACAEAIMARGRSSMVFSRVARSTRFSAPTSIRCSSKPAAGTSRFSMPRGVPTNMTSAPITRAQFLRDGERGNHVAARASSCNDHAHAYSVC